MGNKHTKQTKLTDNERALFYAVKKGVVGMVENLINQNTNVNIRDEDGNTLLIKACSYSTINDNKYDVIVKLLDCKANPNALGNMNTTALHCALDYGHYSSNRTKDIVSVLLRNNAVPFIGNTSNGCVISKAIEFEIPEMVIEMLQHTKSKEPEAIIRYKSYALRIAIEKHKTNIVNALLDFNVVPQNNIIIEPLKTNTPQNIVMKNKNSDSSNCDDITICPICLSTKKDTVLIPCGHTACHNCSQRITNCMNCRALVLDKKKFFL